MGKKYHEIRKKNIKFEIPPSASTKKLATIKKLPNWLPSLSALVYESKNLLNKYTQKGLHLDSIFTGRFAYVRDLNFIHSLYVIRCTWPFYGCQSGFGSVRTNCLFNWTPMSFQLDTLEAGRTKCVEVTMKTMTK